MNKRRSHIIRKYMDGIKNINNKDKKTLLFATHTLEDVSYLCPRSIKLKRGILMFDGDTTNNTKDDFVK